MVALVIARLVNSGGHIPPGLAWCRIEVQDQFVTGRGELISAAIRDKRCVGQYQVIIVGIRMLGFAEIESEDGFVESDVDPVLVPLGVLLAESVILSAQRPPRLHGGIETHLHRACGGQSQRQVRFRNIAGRRRTDAHILIIKCIVSRCQIHIPFGVGHDDFDIIVSQQHCIHIDQAFGR